MHRLWNTGHGAPCGPAADHGERAGLYAGMCGQDLRSGRLRWGLRQLQVADELRCGERGLRVELCPELRRARLR